MGSQKKKSSPPPKDPDGLDLWPITAFVIRRKDSAYALYRYKIDQGKVTEVECEEPNLQSVTLGKMEDEMIAQAHKGVY